MSFLPNLLYEFQAQEDAGAERPPSPLPKGAVNRRRRCSVSAEVDTSKVTRSIVGDHCPGLRCGGALQRRSPKQLASFRSPLSTSNYCRVAV